MQTTITNSSYDLRYPIFLPLLLSSEDCTFSQVCYTTTIRLSQSLVSRIPRTWVLRQRLGLSHIARTVFSDQGLAKKRSRARDGLSIRGYLLRFGRLFV